MSDDGTRLHPAEHRAYRELYLSSRQLLVRWRRLAEALGGFPLARSLESGMDEVRRLLDELAPLTAARGVHGGPAAQGVGASLAQLRSAVLDRGVDAGAAARFAVLDAEHVTTLLLQLAEMAKARRDSELKRFCSRWAKRMRSVARVVRSGAVAIGTEPDRAASPLDASRLSQAIHRTGWAVGTLGEWFDRQVARGREPDEGEQPKGPAG